MRHISTFVIALSLGLFQFSGTAQAQQDAIDFQIDCLSAIIASGGMPSDTGFPIESCAITARMLTASASSEEKKEDHVNAAEECLAEINDGGDMDGDACESVKMALREDAAINRGITSPSSSYKEIPLDGFVESTTSVATAPEVCALRTPTGVVFFAPLDEYIEKATSSTDLAKVVQDALEKDGFEGEVECGTMLLQSKVIKSSADYHYSTAHHPEELR